MSRPNWSLGRDRYAEVLVEHADESYARGMLGEDGWQSGGSRPTSEEAHQRAAEIARQAEKEQTR